MMIEELIRIIVDTECVQQSNESAYTKEQAKISAYDEIVDLFKGKPEAEWIDAEITTTDGSTMPIQACNRCNSFYPLAYTGGGHKFCPGCGARMGVK